MKTPKSIIPSPSDLEKESYEIAKVWQTPHDLVTAVQVVHGGHAGEILGQPISAIHALVRGYAKTLATVDFDMSKSDIMKLIVDGVRIAFDGSEDGAAAMMKIGEQWKESDDGGGSALRKGSSSIRTSHPVGLDGLPHVTIEFDYGVNPIESVEEIIDALRVYQAVLTVASVIVDEENGDGRLH